MNITRTARIASALVLSAGLAGMLTGCAGEPTSTPESAVKSYFGYLADKDLNSAMEASSYDVVKAASEGVMIPKEALAKVEPIKDFKLENVQAGSGQAIANVSYKVGDKKVDSAIDLVDLGSGDKPQWLVNEPLPILDTESVANGVATISGQKVTGDVITVPGVYDVTVSNADGFFEEMNKKVSVTMEGGQNLYAHFAEEDKKYTPKWNEAVSAAWSAYEPDALMDPAWDGSSSGWPSAAESAYEEGLENMIRLVKSPTVGAITYDDVEVEWSAELVDGEWERYTKTGTVDGEYVEENTYGFENQGNVVESFTFYISEGEIVVHLPHFAEDPNEEDDTF